MRQSRIPSVPGGKLRSAAWIELNCPFSHSSLITTSSALRLTAFAMGSAYAPSTTLRAPISRCEVTSRRCSRKGRPWYGRSAFGEPIRLEAPPERMTAASMCYLSALARLENGRSVRFVFQFLMRGNRCIPAHRHQFRHDAHGDLFRRERADLQPHRRVDAFEFFRLVAIVLQRLVHRQNFAFAANHSQVTRLGAHGPGQHTHVFFMTARHDDQVARRIRMNFFKRILVTRVNLLGHRKALFVRERFAVIHHSDAEARRARSFRDRHRNVPTPKEVEKRLRQNRLNKNLQRAAADQSVVVARFIVEMEDHLARCFLLHHFLRRRPDLGLDAPAADCSSDRAILAHQHPRTLIARDRTVSVNDGSERRTLPRPPHLHDLFKQVHVWPQFSAYGAACSLSMRAVFSTLLRLSATFRNLNDRSEAS